jgi:hypothetical protein
MRQERSKVERWSALLAVGVLLPLGVLFVAATGSFTLGGALLVCGVCGYKLGSYMTKGA